MTIINNAIRPYYGKKLKHYVVTHIDTRNWRFVVLDHLNNKLAIFLNGTYRVSNISLKEILSYSYDTHIQRPIKYIYNGAYCYKCKGTGKIDWIQKITGQSLDNFDSMFTRYIRDERYISSLSAPALSKRPWKFAEGSEHFTYGSFPLCKDGEEICPICNGTGLFLLRNSSIKLLTPTNRFLENL